MSPNQTPQLPRCPRCNARLLAQLEQNRLWCQTCGYERHDPQALQILEAYRQAGGEDVLAYSTDSPPNPTELKFLKDAWAAIKNNDLKTARYLCHELVSHNHRLIDAYYMLFMTADNVQEKARHLASILVFSPNHEQAKREMAKLRPIVGDNVKPSYFTAADYREAINQTVHAKGSLEDCPMCGGHTLYVEEDTVRCLSCNYVPDAKTRSQILERRRTDALLLNMPDDGGYHSLKDELIRRKYGGGREWQIAKRVLHCQNCGAQLTLSGSMMTSQCAFCDSQYVLVQDSMQSFQEPDAVLPAELSEEEATAHYYKALPKDVQRLVVRHESAGVFLPYWSFKALVAVIGVRHEGTYELQNILIAAAKEPSQKILEDVQPYHLDNLRPYDQRYLARWSAQLYNLDAIQASITAKAFAKYAALRTELGDDFEDGLLARLDREYEVTGYSLKEHTSLLEEVQFRLLLLPVWMLTMHLEGGGYYHSVINAQTGEVIVTEKVDSKSGVYRSRSERGVPLPAMAGIRGGTVIKPLPRSLKREEPTIKPLPPRR